MFEEQIPDTRKCCATCALWLGNRRPDNWGNKVYVENPATSCYGKCAMHLNSSTTKQATASCQNYQKWEVLK